MSLVSTFDLVIEEQRSWYRVRVRSESLGWPEAKVSIRQVRKALQDRFASLVDRIDQGVRSKGFPTPDEVESLGQWLFSTFFVGEVGEAFNALVATKVKVRLRLTLDDVPQLSKLPWEALCSRHGYLAVHEDMVVVRSLKGVGPCRSLQWESPVQILFLEGMASEEAPLSAQAEAATLGKAIKGRALEIRFFHSELSPPGVAADPHMGKVHVLHFAGHSVSKQGERSYSVVKGPDGSVRCQLSQDWATDLVRHKDLKLVVLNSCEGARHASHSVTTSLAHAIVRAGVPAVVAMQFPISNDAALTFAPTLYRAFADLGDIGRAVTRARLEMRDKVQDEWLSPVLFLRGRVPKIRCCQWIRMWLRRHPLLSAMAFLSFLTLATAGAFYKVVAERYWRALREARVSPKEWLVPGPPDVPGWKCPKLGNTGIELVLIPPGEFTMGSNSGSPEEKPAHTVRLTQPYCIGKTEVTQAEYATVTGGNPSQRKGPDLPVTSVPWNQTEEFVAKLNSRAPGASCSLPSEAQFEYAAGAGKGYAYGVPRASDLFDRGNFLGPRDGYLDLAPVKRFPPNLWGLFGMHGNAGEWVSDRPGRYPPTLAIDPTGPSGSVAGEEDHRIRRGGSFDNKPENATSTSRAVGPDRKMNHIGFRIVCAPVPD